MANVLVDPVVVLHVDGHDIDAVARVVTDRDFRRKVFTTPQTRWYSTQAQLERLVDTAPMIELHF
jgi:hypothetical protein